MIPTKSHRSVVPFLTAAFIVTLLLAVLPSSTNGFTTKHGFKFHENSMLMFDEVCNLSPAFARHFTKKGLIKGLKQHNVEDVTECMLYGIVQEVTPSQHMSKAIKALEDNASNEDLDECEV